MNYKLTLFGAKDTTRTLATWLCDNVQQVDCIVTVDSGRIDTSKISGFTSLREYAQQRGIALFEAANYTLNDDASARFFSENTFDIAISVGWQRLIPQNVLDCFKFGIYGFHGSCGYLPFGRGRSPLNWSIIKGDTRFVLNLFRYDAAADSPNVYQNRMFEITPFDTIRTLQYKNLLCSQDMCRALLKDYAAGHIDICTKSHDFDTFYPKRTPEDGKLDWRLRTRELHNLIRGVTRPFPGAFCMANGNKLTVWTAQPFDAILDFSACAPGEIAAIFDDCPIVRTVDGSLLITDYECAEQLAVGMRLE